KAVKSRASSASRSRGTPVWPHLLGAVLGISSGSVTQAAAQPRTEPPLLFGGARPRGRPEIPIDPSLPTGTRVRPAERPRELGLRVCSWRYPVCVHGQEASSPRLLNSALNALEAAYERVIVALGLPPPLPDWGRGGDDGVDAYLTAPDRPLQVFDDEPWAGPFARSSAFCSIPEVTSDAHWEWARSATLCLAEASSIALDASETPHLKRAFATWVWWLSGLPTSLDVQAIHDVQRTPELAIATRELTPFSEGAAIFFEYLETVRSQSEPLALSTALFSAAASPTPSSADYVNEPDLFDVLRHTLDEQFAKFGALMADFAVARALLGDDSHFPNLAFAGDFGRMRFDWSLDFSSLPRRVLVKPALESTGVVAIRLRLDDVALGQALGFRAEWEAPVSFQWQLVKLNAEGKEMGRIDVPFQERAREAEARVSWLDGVASILIVGTNLEGIDLSHPFDPDVSPFEPHSATVYLSRL
ncbi:MAG TPA: hypothetical protein VFQ61_21945, partial [Polyangiaceae bacterium]|nr:hypothetical protein [Polyangiaceae bacterium]